MMDKRVTPAETLIRAREIAIQNGLRYVYTGNVQDQEGNRTYCHQCHRCLIERRDYDVTRYQLTENGCCPLCQTPCAGVFGKSFGHWGSRRQPVYLRNYE